MITHEQAVTLGRAGGKKGGPARARSLTATQRRQIARSGAEARWSRKEFYTLEDVRNNVRKLDPRLSETDPAFQVAVVLVTILIVGPYQPLVQEFTYFPMDFVAGVFDKLITNEILVRGGKLATEWMDRKVGVISFWLDVCVCLGTIERVKKNREDDHGI